MKIFQTILIFTSTFIIISCCGNKDRIKEMCNEIDADIQTLEYTEIKNEVEGAGVDYSINIILKFDKNNLYKLTKQIISSPYYNNPTQSDANSSYTKLLKDINRRGIWKKNITGYEFIDYGRESEPVRVLIDTTKQTLDYTFVHL
jgi:hypothetical protein